MKPLVFESDSVQTSASIAKQIASNLKHSVVLFVGEMGAGKTSFIQFLAKELGCKTSVTSPTYSLVNTYALEGNSKKKFLHHFDLFRIQNLEEALDFGFEEYLDQKNAYLFIEWPQSIVHWIDKPYHQIEILALGETQRSIRFV
ncbi:MAG: tRNA (adenosine(37)-N6)-threonylcarbamoyltransferase complex ATPase subunit type 1 TsaE [Flavobacteriaceae bacterium]|nr:MAG: tRNA (adenosine(37)-N6)-threonylcarbamoyltransferase complex ATPase subunit type 1 TsaE [Flavobacteriaceae bacterium]